MEVADLEMLSAVLVHGCHINAIDELLLEIAHFGFVVQLEEACKGPSYCILLLLLLWLFDLGESAQQKAFDDVHDSR